MLYESYMGVESVDPFMSVSVCRFKMDLQAI